MAGQRDPGAEVAEEARRGIAYKWLALLTVSIGSYMGPLDGSIVNISFPRLTEIFGTDASVILWVSVAYLLVSTSLMLILGRVGDVHGRKKLYIIGFAIFTLGLTLCSLSQSVLQLIMFRVVQGVGAAMTVALGTAIVTAAFPSWERGKALGILGAVVSAGLLTGPILGGFLLDAFDWRSIFYLRVPIGIIGLIMAWLVLKEQRSGEVGMRFDLRGAFALFASLCCLLLFLNQGARLGWTSPPVLILGASAAIMLALFLFIERRAIQPIVDLSLFRNRLFAAANGSLWIIFIAQAALTFLMPFYLIQGLGYSASKAGLLVIAVALTTVIVAPLSGWLSDKVGSRMLSTAGIALVCLGLFLLSRLGTEPSEASILLRLTVLGAGSGMFQSPNSSSIMGSAPREKLGTASAMIATGRQVGMSTGIALAGAIFTSRQLFYAAQLGGLGPEAVQRAALVGGFHDALTVAAIICGLGIPVSLVRGGYRPRG